MGWGCSKRRCAGLLVEIYSYHFLGNKKHIRFRRKCCWSRVLLPMVYGPTNSWTLDTSSTSTEILTHRWYVMSNGVQSSETTLLHVIVPSDRQAVTFQLLQCGGACHCFFKLGRVSGAGNSSSPLSGTSRSTAGWGKSLKRCLNLWHHRRVEKGMIDGAYVWTPMTVIAKAVTKGNEMQ